MYKGFFKQVGDVEAFLDRDEVRELIGEKYDFYRELWLQHDQKLKGERKKIEVKGRFNLLGVLFLPAWYGYRKMHGNFWAIAVLFSVIAFYESYYDVEVLPANLITMLFLVFATYSRSMYFQSIYARIKKYDALPNKERKEAYLRKHSGISTALGWFYGLGYVLIMVTTVACGLWLGGHLDTVLS
ncbi:MAG: hypothetical protein ACRBDL_06810 [Alphaproteobacteria bacterium]